MTPKALTQRQLTLSKRARRWLRRLPAPVWAMAMIYGVGGSMCLIAAVFPGQPDGADDAATVLGCILLIGSAALVRFGAELSPRAAHLQAAVLVVASGIAISLSGLPGMITAWVLVAGSSVLATEALARLNTRLRAQLVTDPLIGLLSRAGLVSAAERMRAIADHGALAVSIALIDLDQFKQVNDLRGHAAGDQLPIDLGRTWRAELCGTEVLARLGGDEFSLVLAGAGLPGAEDVPDRLRMASRTDWSAGVVEWRRGESLDRAMARADEELYRAKRDARELREAERLAECEPFVQRSSSASALRSA